MAITMYSGSVPVFTQLLPAMSGCLDKAQAFAESRKYDPNLLLQLRLAPDMFPFGRQVQQATAHALAPGRIAGAQIRTSRNAPLSPTSRRASRPPSISSKASAPRRSTVRKRAA